MFRRSTIFLLTVMVLGVATPAFAQYRIASLYGDSSSDIFGHMVSIIGDVDFDGAADFAVTALNDDVNGNNSGTVFVYSGKTRAILYTFFGPTIGGQFGYSLDAAGDVNNDGCPDLIIGSEFGNPNGTGSGTAHVFSGATGQLIWLFNGAAAGDRLGNAVSGAGDVNQDGFDDVIVGANKTDVGGTNTGSARVYSGATGQLLYLFHGLGTNDEFGEAVSDCGDLDGDGYPDVMAGSNYNDTTATDSGMFRIFSGFNGSVLDTRFGGSATEFYGGVLANVGDATGDGIPDIGVGAVGNDQFGTQAGMMRILSGADRSVVFTYFGAVAGDLLGRWIDTAGDVNGDGHADFFIGVPFGDFGATNTGGVRVYSGVDGTLIGSYFGQAAGAELGDRVSGGADIDGDGFVDLIVGSPGDDTTATNAGAAHVLTFAAAAKYGVNPSSPTQTLQTSFIRGSGGAELQGTLLTTGIDPFATTIIAASALPGNSTIAATEVLIDSTPGTYLAVFTGADAFGQVGVPLNLRQPAIAGQVYYLQVFAGSSTAPQAIVASHGTRLVFCP